jgi:hypothetical protein
LDEFLALVKDYIGKPIRRLMRRYMQKEWEMRGHMWKYIKRKQIIGDRNVLDFHEAFTTVGVTYGASDVIHADRNDAGTTWVFPIGEWEGADLCMVQVGKGVEILPGDGFAFHANTLAHCSSKLVSGERVVLTCFTDKIIFGDADASDQGLSATEARSSDSGRGNKPKTKPNTQNQPTKPTHKYL